MNSDCDPCFDICPPCEDKQCKSNKCVICPTGPSGPPGPPGPSNDIIPYASGIITDLNVTGSALSSLEALTLLLATPGRPLALADGSSGVVPSPVPIGFVDINSLLASKMAWTSNLSGTITNLEARIDFGAVPANGIGGGTGLSIPITFTFEMRVSSGAQGSINSAMQPYAPGITAVVTIAPFSAPINPTFFTSSGLALFPPISISAGDNVLLLVKAVSVPPLPLAVLGRAFIDMTFSAGITIIQ